MKNLIISALFTFNLCQLKAWQVNNTGKTILLFIVLTFLFWAMFNEIESLIRRK